VRGAPHVHRRRDLAEFAITLWPHNDADAMARLRSERTPLKAAGISGLTAFSAMAEAMRAVVTTPMPKGEVSAAVTARLPQAYSYRCRPCDAVHIYGGFFQLVGLPAGVRHRPGSSPLMLTPLEDRPPVPSVSVGAHGLVRTYLRLHGPATIAEAAGYLGTSQAETRPVWPSDLVEVHVDGRRCWLPEEQVSATREAPPPSFVRLLPPLDPYLQGRDRALLVPNPAHQKALWRVIGNPGAVLVNGEITGTWQAKAAGRKRLEITVRSFAAVSGKDQAAIEEEAARIATTRGLSEARVSYQNA
jgi:hypothetical protein